MNGRLRDTFSRSSMSSDQALAMNTQDQTETINRCLSILSEYEDWENYEEGGTMMHRVLQPYFALSGYKLRAEPEVANKHQFDLVGDNILKGDDRILVDYKFNREGSPRSLIPNAIIDFVTNLSPSDVSRVIMVSPEGFDANISAVSTRNAGPRLELWSFADVKERLVALRDAQPVEDAYVDLVLDFIDKLALAIAQEELDLHRLEWREVERLIAHVLAELGYATHLTRGGNDGGRDVIVADVQQSGVPVFNIEVKHWLSAQVGKKETKRVIEVALRERRDGAVLWASSGVSQAAIEARSESHVDYLHFANGDKLSLACRSFARKRGGLWSGVRPFQSFILDTSE
ncbi:restriction endonuclease [uncultured Roseobacter sp.]|uniref:restriction endonuclease n=1 Tax=uncultured Roseobacter sp. TaxID=114847 RepID=UPI00262C0D18|nr:restriction endonuclease [uncultured Roseobacter sp.]